LRYFEDFTVGEKLALAPFHVTAGEIAGFAAQFGSLPWQDGTPGEDAPANDAPAASGWHGCAIFMAMMYRGWLSQTAFLGAPGIDTVRWRSPILAGDALDGFSEILATRPSKSRPQMGFVQARHTIARTGGDVAMVLENPMMFTCRSQPS